MSQYHKYIAEIPQWVWDKSDGCTLAPELKHSKCCVMHDYLVAVRKMDRKQADDLTRECIKAQYSNKLLGVIISTIYWLGMRAYSLSGYRFK